MQQLFLVWPFTTLGPDASWLIHFPQVFCFLKHEGKVFLLKSVACGTYLIHSKRLWLSGLTVCDGEVNSSLSSRLEHYGQQQQNCNTKEFKEKGAQM